MTTKVEQCWCNEVPLLQHGRRWPCSLPLLWPHRNVVVRSGGWGGVSAWNSPQQRHKFEPWTHRAALGRLWCLTAGWRSSKCFSASKTRSVSGRVSSPRWPLNGWMVRLVRRPGPPWGAEPRGSQMTAGNMAWRSGQNVLSCTDYQQDIKIHLLALTSDLWRLLVTSMFWELKLVLLWHHF